MKYGAILIDPPWRFETRSEKGRDRCPDAKVWGVGQNNKPERHYETMTLDDIKALPVAENAAKDCAVFMWAIDSMVPHALDVGKAWGMTFKTVAFYWVKLRKEGSVRGLQQSEPDKQLFPIGTGYWTRPNPEQCLLFTRGAPKRVARDVRKLIVAPRREHSRKPDETYERVERLVAGPYLEMFARQRRPGWDAWGNEVDKFTPTPMDIFA